MHLCSQKIRFLLHFLLQEPSFGHSLIWQISSHLCPQDKGLLHASVHKASFEQLTFGTIYYLHLHSLSTLYSQGGHSSVWQLKWQGCPHYFSREHGCWHSGGSVPHGWGGAREVYLQTQVIGSFILIGHLVHIPRWQKSSQLCLPHDKGF